jgi:fatty-acyl-CoA synthase
VPRQLIERYRDELGVELIQGWGMTETSPLCALAIPPRGTPPEEEIEWRTKAGRVVPGVEIRVAAEDGTILPNDGTSVGEFEVRGPWVTGSYFKEPAPERFHDGWLRTGDIGSLDEKGFMQISDRTKDVIKSGGEWISSVELENEVMAHPEVVEAAVIAVPDDRWSERPLVAVVLEEGSGTSADELVAFLTERVSRWWLPERWAFVTEVPKTSVGKFDKKVLRARYAEGTFEVVEVAVSIGR